ncbi:hypothetical protein IJ596_03380 [bacterium]|nr:hypothetical protein [bacterium]
MKIGSMGKSVYAAVKKAPKPVKYAALGAVGTSLLASSLVSKQDEEGKKSTSKLAKVLAVAAGVVAAVVVGKKVASSVKIQNALKMAAHKAKKFVKVPEQAAKMEAPKFKKAVETLEPVVLEKIPAKMQNMADLIKKVAASSANSEEFKQCLSRVWLEYQAFAKKYPSYDKFLREKFGGLLQVIFKVPAK